MTNYDHIWCVAHYLVVTSSLKVCQSVCYVICLTKNIWNHLEIQQSHSKTTYLIFKASHSMLLYKMFTLSTIPSCIFSKRSWFQNSVLVTLGTKTDTREHCFTISGNYYCFEASLQTQSLYKHRNYGNTNLKCQEKSKLIGSQMLKMTKHHDVWGSCHYVWCSRLCVQWSMFWLGLRVNKGLHD